MRFKEFLTGEDGVATVEIILILVVLIALVIIFRDNLKKLVDDIFKNITTKSNTVMK